MVSSVVRTKLNFSDVLNGIPSLMNSCVEADFLN